MTGGRMNPWTASPRARTHAWIDRICFPNSPRVQGKDFDELCRFYDRVDRSAAWRRIQRARRPDEAAP
jgi:hypothetical protein